MKILTHAAKRLMIAFHEVLIEATADNSGLDQSSKNRCQEIARSLEARPNVERAIMDAEQVLRCRDKNMTFAEFLRSPFSVETTWCRVDVVQAEDQVVAVVLQWEPSVYKWFMPLPVEGRVECGCHDQVGPIREYGGLKGRISAVRLIVPDIVLAT